jgi:hypothetical protein
VLFALNETTTWSFDTGSDIDDGGNTLSHPVDTAAQARFYFHDGDLVQALSKGAMARSVHQESIDKKVAAAINAPIPGADGAAVLKKAQSMIEGTREGANTAALCDF